MNIPPALLDRIGSYPLGGLYRGREAPHRKPLPHPQTEAPNGLAAEDLSIDDAATTHLIRYYTKEAGVRGLEREIAKLSRKVVTEQALEGKQHGPR